MGGLLAADTLLEFANSRPDEQAPLWPRIIALIAFDTPVCAQFPWFICVSHCAYLQYLGLHPYVFKNSAEKAAAYADTARTVATGIFGGLAGFGATKASQPTEPPAGLITDSPSSGRTSWTKWASYGGAVLATGAAAGTAYYKRDDLTLGYTWATDHMKYVGNLWDENKLRKRVENVIDLQEKLGVLFRT